MSKKQRIMPIAEKIEINSDAFTASSLPDSDAVNQTIAIVTGKTLPPSVEAPLQQRSETIPSFQNMPQPPKQIGRPKKEIADGRIKYNTMIKPEWIRKLRIRAAEQDISPADLLERILQETALLK